MRVKSSLQKCYKCSRGFSSQRQFLKHRCSILMSVFKTKKSGKTIINKRAMKNKKSNKQCDKSSQDLKNKLALCQMRKFPKELKVVLHRLNIHSLGSNILDDRRKGNVRKQIYRKGVSTKIVEKPSCISLWKLKNFEPSKVKDENLEEEQVCRTEEQGDHGLKTFNKDHITSKISVNKTNAVDKRLHAVSDMSDSCKKGYETINFNKIIESSDILHKKSIEIVNFEGKKRNNTILKIVLKQPTMQNKLSVTSSNVENASSSNSSQEPQQNGIFGLIDSELPLWLQPDTPQFDNKSQDYNSGIDNVTDKKLTEGPGEQTDDIELPLINIEPVIELNEALDNCDDMFDSNHTYTLEDFLSKEQSDDSAFEKMFRKVVNRPKYTNRSGVNSFEMTEDKKTTPKQGKNHPQTVTFRKLDPVKDFKELQIGLQQNKVITIPKKTHYPNIEKFLPFYWRLHSTEQQSVRNSAENNVSFTNSEGTEDAKKPMMVWVTKTR